MPLAELLPRPRSSVASIVAPFAEPQQSGPREPPTFADARVARIKSICRNQMNRRLTLPSLAGETGLSASRLCHLFKIHTGLAPARYLKQVRMERARELLETTFLSVKEICARVGLNGLSHFVRDFEKIYGLSPARHRMKAGVGSGG